MLFLSNSFNDLFLRLRFFEYKKKFLVQNFCIEELSVRLIAKFSVKIYISYGNCTSSILLSFFYYYYYFNRLMKIKPFYANACVALLYVNHYCYHYYFHRYYYYYYYRYYYHNYYHHYYFHLCYDTIFLKIYILPTYYFAKRKIFFNFNIVMQNKLHHVYLHVSWT